MAAILLVTFFIQDKEILRLSTELGAAESRALAELNKFRAECQAEMKAAQELQGKHDEAARLHTVCGCVVTFFALAYDVIAADCVLYDNGVLHFQHCG